MEIINDYQESLPQSFHFGAADLEVNRTGRISERQLQNLAVESAKWGLYVLRGFGGAVLLALFAPLMYPQANGSFSIYSFALTALGISVVVGLKWLLIMLDRFEKSCKMIEGEVTHRHVNAPYLSRSRGMEFFEVAIQTVKFRVNAFQDYALQEHQRYRIYYAPHSKTIVAAEPLD